jgi:hypothetical protein
MKYLMRTRWKTTTSGKEEEKTESVKSLKEKIEEVKKSFKNENLGENKLEKKVEVKEAKKNIEELLNKIRDRNL